MPQPTWAPPMGRPMPSPTTSTEGRPGAGASCGHTSAWASPPGAPRSRWRPSFARSPGPAGWRPPCRRRRARRKNRCLQNVADARRNSPSLFSDRIGTEKPSRLVQPAVRILEIDEQLQGKPRLAQLKALVKHIRPNILRNT